MTTATESVTKLAACCKWLGLHDGLVAILMILPVFLNAVRIRWLPFPAFAIKTRVEAPMVRHIAGIRNVESGRVRIAGKVGMP